MFQENAIKKIMSNIEGVSFPRLLMLLRHECGITYTKISVDTGIGLRRLQRLETGMFRNPLSDWEVKNLATFYGIDPKILNDLMVEYVTTNKHPRKIKL